MVIRLKERQGIITISPSELLEELGFTAGELMDIKISFEKHSIVELKMKHPNLPVSSEDSHLVHYAYREIRDKGDL